jgi:hypothetical protein
MFNLGRVRAIGPLFCLLAASLLPAPAVAGPAQPPLEQLFSPESRLILGELTEINPAGRVVFKRIKVYGKAVDVPELVDISATESTIASVQLGETYVVGYTLFHHDRQHAGGMAPNRRGGILTTAVGLDPALFRDSKAIQTMLSLAKTERGRESGRLRRLLLDALVGDDAPLQLLAAGQIAYDFELGKRLNAKDRAAIARIGSDPETRIPVRLLLIAAAAERPGVLGEWWADAIRAVLASTPIGGYASGAKDPTGLVLLAFAEVEARLVPVPLESVTRWLRSPYRLFVERACAVLGAVYPADKQKALEEALGDSSLSQENKSYLDDQLNLLKRPDAG